MDRNNSPNEITRESLVNVLDIMHSLATPKELPSLLRELITVGREAIVAETGLLWLVNRETNALQQLVPNDELSLELDAGKSWAANCASHGTISNIRDCQKDDLYNACPSQLNDAETLSLLNVPIVGQGDLVIGVMQWLGAELDQFDSHDEWIGSALAAQAAVAIQHERMTDELLAAAKLNQEVAIAKEIQTSTLPSEMPELVDYDLHGHFQPTDHTGGDLFDLVMLNDQLFMLLGDATGHGFGPALSATQMQAMFRVAFRLGADLDSAYIHVNNQLEEDLPDDRFITAFVGFLNPDTHRITYHSGGQGPILVYRAASQICEWYKPTHFPLGVMPMQESLDAEHIELHAGDILALISDGVYEYNNEAGEEFGEQRVEALFREHSNKTSATLNDLLLRALTEFAGSIPQADDITLVFVKRQASS